MSSFNKLNEKWGDFSNDQKFDSFPEILAIQDGEKRDDFIIRAANDSDSDIRCLAFRRLVPSLSSNKKNLR